jgi:hypothetical protein
MKLATLPVLLSQMGTGVKYRSRPTTWLGSPGLVSDTIPSDKIAEAPCRETLDLLVVKLVMLKETVFWEFTSSVANNRKVVKMTNTTEKRY